MKDDSGEVKGIRSVPSTLADGTTLNIIPNAYVYVYTVEFTHCTGDFLEGDLIHA
jgi:hypothetical protein